MQTTNKQKVLRLFGPRGHSFYLTGFLVYYIAFVLRAVELIKVFMFTSRKTSNKFYNNNAILHLDFDIFLRLSLPRTHLWVPLGEFFVRTE